jgi:hypothetical protein
MTTTSSSFSSTPSTYDSAASAPPGLARRAHSMEAFWGVSMTFGAHLTQGGKRGKI